MGLVVASICHLCCRIESPSNVSVIYMYSLANCVALCRAHVLAKSLTVNTNFPLCGWHVPAALAGSVLSGTTDVVNGALNNVAGGRRLQGKTANVSIATWVPVTKALPQSTAVVGHCYVSYQHTISVCIHAFWLCSRICHTFCG